MIGMRRPARDANQRAMAEWDGILRQSGVRRALKDGRPTHCQHGRPVGGVCLLCERDTVATVGQD